MAGQEVVPITPEQKALAEAIGVRLGRIRMSINFLELFTVLVHTGLMKARSSVSTIPIPPLYTFTYDRVPLTGYYILTSEFNIAVDTDNALEEYIYIDGEEAHTDGNILQQTYAYPTNFFRLGALIPIKSLYRTVIKNKTASTVYITVWTKYGEILRSVYDAVVKAYFSTVLEEAGG